MAGAYSERTLRDAGQETANSAPGDQGYPSGQPQGGCWRGVGGRVAGRLSESDLDARSHGSRWAWGLVSGN